MSIILARLLVLLGTIGVSFPAFAETDAIRRYHQLTQVNADGCIKAQRGDEIVVCGSSALARQQRLPFPDVRGDGDDQVIIQGEVAAASASPVRLGSCSTRVGQGSCNKGVRVATIGGGGFNLGTNGESDAPLVLRALGHLIEPNATPPAYPKPRE
jgi:hypothetical protein